MAQPSSIGEHFKAYGVVILGKTILTTVTKLPDAVTAWINAVNADGNTVCRHVGFEVEFHNNTTRIGTVQLCVGNHCLVFQLPGDTSPCPLSLDRFLGDSNNTFVSANIQSKMKLLRQQFPFRAVVWHCMDLGEIAPQPTDEKQSLLALIALETDWGRPSDLSLHHVHYACLDAFLNLQIARRLCTFSWPDYSFFDAEPEYNPNLLARKPNTCE